MKDNPGEYYAQTLCVKVEKLEFKGVKLQVGKVPKINQKDFFKLSEKIFECFSKDSRTNAAHKSLGEQENDPNRGKYDNLINNLDKFLINQNGF